MFSILRGIARIFSKLSPDVAADYICDGCGHRYITLGRADRTTCPGCDEKEVTAR